MKNSIKVGDRVTGIEGRDSHGWHGIIKEIEPFGESQYYRVYWQEREELKNHGGAIVGMTPDQIRKTNGDLS